MMFTKLALVDPTRLDPKHLEYKELSKNPQVVVKAGLSTNIRDILKDPSMPDDIKVKLYSQALDRFLKVGNALDPEDSKPLIINQESTTQNQNNTDGLTVKKGRKRKQKPEQTDSSLSFKSAATPSSSSTPKLRKSSRQRKKRQLSPGWVTWK
jgi:hypothetical protein